MKVTFYTIVKNILTQEKTFTYESISKQLKVSQKTIRNRIIDVEKFLKKYNLELKKQPGVGIKLIGNNNDILKCYQNCQINLKNNNFITSHTREKVILFYLLNYQKKLTIGMLENILFITRPSLYNSLKRIEKILNNYDIKINRNRLMGIYLDCGEKRKRLCLLDLTIDLYNDDLNEYKNFPLIIDYYNYIYQNSLNKNQSFIKKYFDEISSNFNLKISKNDQDRVTILFLIAFYRIKKGNITTVKKQLLYKKYNQKIYNYLNEKKYSINSHFGILLNNDELLYLSSLITSNINAFQTIKTEDKNNYILKIVNEFYKYVKDIIGFENYEYFESKMFSYLLKIIHKKEFENDITNASTNLIKEMYPEVFERCLILKKLCKEISTASFSDHIISTITLLIEELFIKHTCKVTCLYQIENNNFERELNIELLKMTIPNITIIKNEEYKNEQFDFIISNKPQTTTKPIFITPKIFDKECVDLILKSVKKIIDQRRQNLLKNLV